MRDVVAEAWGSDGKFYRVFSDHRVGRTLDPECGRWEFNFGMDTNLVSLVVDAVRRVERRETGLAGEVAGLKSRVAALEPTPKGAIAAAAEEDPEGRRRMAQKFIARELHRLAEDLRNLTGDDDA